MTNQQYTELSHSNDCPKAQPHQLKEIALREAVIGDGMVIKRALPNRDKRMIGAWCFLDHAGPVKFNEGEGLDVGPHPHIGLQTFTWMIDGTVNHDDSLGSKQLIRPKQVNIMTAGRGISHTEVAPKEETGMHTAQLWIALPDSHRHMEPKFEHHPVLPTAEKEGALVTVLVGDFLGQTSPVTVYTPMMGADIEAQQDIDIKLELNPAFEYGVLALEGEAQVNGHALTQDNMLVLEVENHVLHLRAKQGTRLLLIGGEPFESEILLWWNFVARTQEEMAQARQDWIDGHERFGTIPAYQGPSLIAPPLPEKMRASK